MTTIDFLHEHFAGLFILIIFVTYIIWAPR